MESRIERKSSKDPSGNVVTHWFIYLLNQKLPSHLFARLRAGLGHIKYNSEPVKEASRQGAPCLVRRASLDNNKASSGSPELCRQKEEGPRLSGVIEKTTQRKWYLSGP